MRMIIRLYGTNASKFDSARIQRIRWRKWISENPIEADARNSMEHRKKRTQRIYTDKKTNIFAVLAVSPW